jgi:hypothetical protein
MKAYANLTVAEFGRRFSRQRPSGLAEAANDNSGGRAQSSAGAANPPSSPKRGRDRTLDDGALVSFLAAGAVLFASLVIGSSGSLFLTGSDAMMTAIDQAFLSLGLRAIGVGLVATAACLAFAASWQRRRH